METLAVEDLPVTEMGTSVEPTSEASTDESASPATCDRMGTAACNLACGNITCPVWAIRPQPRNEEKPSSEGDAKKDGNEPPQEDANASLEKEDKTKPRSYAEQLADDRTDVVTARWKTTPKTSVQEQPSEMRTEQSPTSTPTKDQERTELRSQPQKTDSPAESSQPQQISKPTPKAAQTSPEVIVSKKASSAETVSLTVEESTQPQQSQSGVPPQTEKSVITPKVSETHQPPVVEKPMLKTTSKNHSEPKVPTYQVETPRDSAPEKSAPAPTKSIAAQEQTDTPSSNKNHQTIRSDTDGNTVIEPKEHATEAATAIHEPSAPATPEAAQKTHYDAFSRAEIQPLHAGTEGEETVQGSYDANPVAIEQKQPAAASADVFTKPTQPDDEVTSQSVALEPTEIIDDIDDIFAEPATVKDIPLTNNSEPTDMIATNEQTSDTLFEIEPTEEPVPHAPLGNGDFSEHEVVEQPLDEEISNVDETLPTIEVVNSPEASTTVEQELHEGSTEVDNEHTAIIDFRLVSSDDVDGTEPAEIIDEIANDMPPTKQIFAEGAHDIVQPTDVADHAENDERLLAMDTEEEPPCPYRLVDEDPDEEVVEPDEATMQTALETVITNEAQPELNEEFVGDESFDITAQRPSRSNGIRSIRHIARRLIGQIAYILAA